MTRWIFLLTLGLGIVSSAASQNGEAMRLLESHQVREQGAVDAASDVAGGVPKWHLIGLPGNRFAYSEWVRLLRERYGLRIIGHGDDISGTIFAYVSGYNEVVEDSLDRQYGKGVLDRTYQEAQSIAYEGVESLFPGETILNPDVLRNVKAPAGACEGVSQCLVYIGMVVQPNGVPSDLEVMRSPNLQLDDIALAAAARSRFEPARDLENGRTFRFYVSVRFRAE